MTLIEIKKRKHEKTSKTRFVNKNCNESSKYPEACTIKNFTKSSGNALKKTSFQNCHFFGTKQAKKQTDKISRKIYLQKTDQQKSKSRALLSQAWRLQ